MVVTGMNEDPLGGLKKILRQQQETMNLITFPSQMVIDQAMAPANAFQQIVKKHSLMMGLGNPPKEFLKFTNPAKDVFRISKEIAGIQGIFNQTEQIQRIIEQMYQPAISPELLESVSRNIKFPEWKPQGYFQNIDLVETFNVLDELATDLPGDSVDVASESLSDGEIQIVAEQVQFWLDGRASLSRIIEKIMANGLASTIVYGFMYDLIKLLLFIALALHAAQYQADQDAVETIQQVVKAEFGPYKVVKKYIESRQLQVSQPLGLSRTEVTVREAPGKKSAAIPGAVMPPQTVVIILASDSTKIGEKDQFKPRQNWRRISVEINGAYVEGWVPESTVPRLKSHQMSH